GRGHAGIILDPGARHGVGRARHNSVRPGGLPARGRPRRRELSAWGLANAVTRTAEDAADYDRATELEAAGRRLIELGQAEWKPLTACTPHSAGHERLVWSFAPVGPTTCLRQL